MIRSAAPAWPAQQSEAVRYSAPSADPVTERPPLDGAEGPTREYRPADGCEGHQRSINVVLRLKVPRLNALPAPMSRRLCQGQTRVGCLQQGHAVMHPSRISARKRSSCMARMARSLAIRCSLRQNT
jgi:hypothetical protein